VQDLLSEIRACRHCEEHLPLGPRPILAAETGAKIMLIGQAPGTKVHASGIPWNDPSGVLLRKWMQVDEQQFYDPSSIAIVPMGFCYPGKGKTGDLPPRKECAELWHDKLNAQLQKVELKILIGQYAQSYYLGKGMKRNLTETVRNYLDYFPDAIPLPHPSPRNRYWLYKNPWFEEEVLPAFRERLGVLIS
jgi:uracil-DNA glycosylase